MGPILHVFSVFALLSVTASEFPDFNWNRVPLNIRFGQRTGDLTDEQIAFLASQPSIDTR